MTDAVHPAPDQRSGTRPKRKRTRSPMTIVTVVAAAIALILAACDIKQDVAAGTSRATTPPIQVSIKDENQNAYYSFEVTQADVDAGKVVAWQLFGSNIGTVYHSLLGPSGNPVGSTLSRNGDTTIVSAPVTEPGRYTVKLDPYGANTGDAFLWIIMPVDRDQAVAPGDAIASTTAIPVSIADPGQNAYYRFTVTNADVAAGKVVTWQLSNSGIGTVYHTLLGPNGNPIGSTLSRNGDTTIVSAPVTQPGTYTVKLDPYNTNTGSAGLRVAVQAP
jgi:hypothetical protein